MMIYQTHTPATDLPGLRRLPYVNGPDFAAQIKAAVKAGNTRAQFDFEGVDDVAKVLAVLTHAKAKGLARWVYGRAPKSLYAPQFPHPQDREQRMKACWFARSHEWAPSHALTTRVVIDGYMMPQPSHFTDAVDPDDAGWKASLAWWQAMVWWSVIVTREEMRKPFAVELWHRAHGGAMGPGLGRQYLGLYGKSEPATAEIAADKGLYHYFPIPLWVWREMLVWCKGRDIDVIWWGQPPGEVLGNPSMSRYQSGPEPSRDVEAYRVVACEVFGIKAVSLTA